MDICIHNGQPARKVAGCCIQHECMTNMTSYRIGACYTNENLTTRILENLLNSKINAILRNADKFGGSPPVLQVGKETLLCLSRIAASQHPMVDEML